MVDRALVREERDYVKRVAEVFRRVQSYGQLYASNFTELGLKPPFAPSPYEPLKIWPAKPKTEREFWLYLAHATTQAGGGIPPFMLPVTNLAEVGETLRRFLREREIDQWRHRLHDFNATVKAEAEASTVELRLALTASMGELQWRQS
ncbi:MAG: hypothetical protein RLZZ584_3325, partial [Pseudomonadota bacterium]